MSCARSSCGAGAEDPSIKLGSSSLTYSLKGDLGESSKISGGVRDQLSKKKYIFFWDFVKSSLIFILQK